MRKSRFRFTLIELLIVIVFLLALSLLGPIGCALYWGVGLVEDAVHNQHQTTSESLSED